MRPTDMHRLGHSGCHEVSPKGWHDVPVLCGDYDLDATILHRNNKDLPLRLSLYVKRRMNAYGPRTNYTGYKGNGGDD